MGSNEKGGGYFFQTEYYCIFARIGRVMVLKSRVATATPATPVARPLAEAKENVAIVSKGSSDLLPSEYVTFTEKVK